MSKVSPSPVVFLSKYLLHILFIVGIANFFLVRGVKFFISANTCISQDQWVTMRTDPNHCYVQYSSDGETEIFETPSHLVDNVITHRGNSICGQDVTNLIPQSHTSDPIKYLTNTYRGKYKQFCDTHITAVPIAPEALLVQKSTPAPITVITPTPPLFTTNSTSKLSLFTNILNYLTYSLLGGTVIFAIIKYLKK